MKEVTRPTENSWVGGAILIGIGIVLLAGQLFTFSGWIVLATISALFFALWLGTRQYGFVIPAMILAGLAIGVGWEDSLTSQSGGEVVLGLAGAFIGIYVVNAFTHREAQWWPLIPGGILAVVGGSQVFENTQYATWISQFWPVALIVAGLLVLFANFRRTTHTEATTDLTVSPKT